MPLRRCGLLCLTLGVCACAVDDRKLLLADDAGTVGSAARGGTGSRGGTGGEGGDGPSSGGLVDGCADLDTDGVADCEVTLVENASFTSDVEGWIRLNDAELAWDERNALDDLPSGSAKLSAAAPRTTGPRILAFQCAALEGQKLVIAYASAFVEAGEADDLAQAALEVFFYRDDDCGGALDGSFETPPTEVVDEWMTIQAGGLSLDRTRSFSIALVGIEASADSDLTVYFDNVMVKAIEP